MPQLSKRQRFYRMSFRVELYSAQSRNLQFGLRSLGGLGMTKKRQAIRKPNKMIKIYITVKTNAKEMNVEQISEREYKVSVKATPIQGKANIAVVNALAEYFKVTKAEVSITGGYFGKKKIVEIGWN